MKKLTKKLFIIAMIAAGTALSKPAFAIKPAKNSQILLQEPHPVDNTPTFVNPILGFYLED